MADTPSTSISDDVITAPTTINNGSIATSECSSAVVHSQTLIGYKMAVEVYLVGALCVAGLIGNALSIAVLRRDRDKPNTTNWLLQTLAAVDTVYLVASFVIQTLKVLYEMTDWLAALDAASTSVGNASVTSSAATSWPTPPSAQSLVGAVTYEGGMGGHLSWLRRVYPYIEVHAWSVASIAQTVTVWLVMLVTVDRYVAVCLPMKAEWRSLKRAKMTMIVVVVTAAIYNIPRFFERTVVHETRCYNGLSWATTQTTGFRKDRYYFIIYKTICYFVFRAVGPLTAIIVLNVRLVRGLRQVRRRRAKMFGAGKSNGSKAAAATKHHENLTLMLITVVTVFIVCQLPTLLVRVAFTIMELKVTVVNFDLVTLRYLNVAANALLTLNSAVNFLIYCLIGKKFRRILLNEMCFRCPGVRCGCGGQSATAFSSASSTAGTQQSHVMNVAGGSASASRKIAVAGRLTDETEDELLCGQLRKTMVSCS